MDATFDTAESGSMPELTPLGKRLELLRIQRGLSKQVLARRAGTSRQQLWRVMTGKSELALGLRHRLADVLGVDQRALDPRSVDALGDGTLGFGSDVLTESPRSFESYVDAAAAVRATLRSLPADDIGRQLKRELLDAIEECAHVRGVRLSTSFFALRGEVINGDL